MSAPEGVDPETGEIISAEFVEVVDHPTFPRSLRLAHGPLDRDGALLLTAHITASAHALCWLVKEAKDRGAWRVLGHESWGEYVEERLQFSRQHADQLYKQALANEAAALAVGLAAGDVNLPEWTLRGLNAETVAAMAKEVVLSLPAGTLSKREWANEIERGLRKAIAERKPQVSASTAVDIPPASETTETTRVSVSHTTTTKPSSGRVPAPGAGESGGEAPPALPAAPLPDAGAREGRGDRDGDEGQPDASRDREAASTPGSGGAVGDAPAPEDHAGEAPDVEATQDAESSPSSPASDPEPVLDGLDSGSGSLDRAQVSTAFAAALTLLTIDPKEAAGLLVGDERDDRAADCERIVDWLLSHHDAVMDRTLRSVTA